MGEVDEGQFSVALVEFLNEFQRICKWRPWCGCWWNVCIDITLSTSSGMSYFHPTTS
jgi:hypothetical protein